MDWLHALGRLICEAVAVVFLLVLALFAVFAIFVAAMARRWAIGE